MKKNETKLSRTLANPLFVGCICALSCETIYGLGYMFTKQATDLATPFALLGWRFMTAAVLMTLLIFCGVIKTDFKGKFKRGISLKPLALVVLFSPAVYYIAETIGIDRTTSSESGTFLACIPIASLAASTLILKKKPSKVQVIGIAVTLIGVLFTVFAVGSSSSLSLLGYGALTVAVIAYALYCTFVDKANEFSGAEITYAMLLAGAALFVPLAICESLILGNTIELVTLPFRETGFLVAILYLGIASSIIAFFLSNIAIAKIGVNRTSSFLGVSTVVSIISGILVLHESFSVWQIAGAAIILAGVYIANTGDKSQFES